MKVEGCCLSKVTENQTSPESLMYAQVHARARLTFLHACHDRVRVTLSLLFTTPRVNWRSWSECFNCLSDLSKAQSGEVHVWNIPATVASPPSPSVPLPVALSFFSPLSSSVPSSLHLLTEACHVVSQSVDLSLQERSSDELSVFFFFCVYVWRLCWRLACRNHVSQCRWVVNVTSAWLYDTRKSDS